MPISEHFNRDFIQPLVDWYTEQAADLPWRVDKNPYRVWLSEIMLQQTQVGTVIPYFERFIAHYPTVYDLARANRDGVLKLWEGLGYYSRAHNLHKAAKMVVDEFNGQFPATVEMLQTLPGVGRYTAGAVASIAYGKQVSLADGNVIRVFTRLFDIETDIKKSTTRKYIEHTADKLVPESNPGDYNQALMELGRTICRPRNPLCQECPVRIHCEAYKKGVQNERPVTSKAAPPPHYEVTAGLIRNAEGQFLIAQRKEEAMLGGLWEFPGGKKEADESLQECLQRELNEELGIRVNVGTLFVKVRHAYTHFKITLYVYECTYLSKGGEPQTIDCADWQWVSEDEFEKFAFSAADRQVIEALKARRYQLL